jgi:hypothetical protein
MNIAYVLVVLVIGLIMIAPGTLSILVGLSLTYILVKQYLKAKKLKN